MFWREIFSEFIRCLKQQSDDSRVTCLQTRRSNLRLPSRGGHVDENPRDVVVGNEFFEGTVSPRFWLPTRGRPRTSRRWRWRRPCRCYPNLEGRRRNKKYRSSERLHHVTETRSATARGRKLEKLDNQKLRIGARRGSLHRLVRCLYRLTKCVPRTPSRLRALRSTSSRSAREHVYGG